MTAHDLGDLGQVPNDGDEREPAVADELAGADGTGVAVFGTARVDRRTKDLAKRILRGEIAVVDHLDLDPVAADSLVTAGVTAVVNASPSFSGRYPNLGPLQLVRAGVIVIDDVGPEVMDTIADGDEIAVLGDAVLRAGAVVVSGQRRTISGLEEEVEEARRNVGEQLELFASNTLEYLRRERHLATDNPELPPTRVEFKDRHALVVVRGVDYKEDLAALKRSGYLREVKPVIIGVDGGADAARDVGLTPDIVIGDFDSVGEASLHCGAELIVHAYPGGRAPGADRLDELGLEHLVFESPGTSEDIAMLLAYEKGASLIVAVGTHSSMEDFLDKGRAGMASTFLVRLKVGRALVDVKGVNRLYRPVVKGRDVLMLGTSMLAAIVAMALANEPLRIWMRSVWLWLRSRFA
jgi:uncharacterized membrane-anchored protein